MRVAKLFADAILPTRKHPTDAGMDFYSMIDITIPPHSFEVVSTGITVEVPKGTMLLLKPKSRSNFLLGAGVVDEGYQGEILVKVYNGLGTTLKISYGDAIAQGIIVPVLYEDIEAVSLPNIHPNRSSRQATGGIVTQLKE